MLAQDASDKGTLSCSSPSSLTHMTVLRWEPSAQPSCQGPFHHVGGHDCKRQRLRNGGGRGEEERQREGSAVMGDRDEEAREAEEVGTHSTSAVLYHMKNKMYETKKDNSYTNLLPVPQVAEHGDHSSSCLHS